jgi:hypothetical protein
MQCRTRYVIPLRPLESVPLVINVIALNPFSATEREARLLLQLIFRISIEIRAFDLNLQVHMRPQRVSLKVSL